MTLELAALWFGWAFLALALLAVLLVALVTRRRLEDQAAATDGNVAWLERRIHALEVRQR